MKMYFIYHEKYCQLNIIYFVILLITCITCYLVGGTEIRVTVPKVPIVVPVTQLKESLHLPLNEVFFTSYPPWVNTTLLRIGQSFTRKNFMEFTYATLMGLGILANTDFTRIFLGIVNVMNPDKARKRYLSNSVHFNYWSMVDLTKDPSNLFESLNLIHAIHVKAVHNTTGRSRHRYNVPIIPEPKPGTNPYNVNLEAWDAVQDDLRNSRYKELIEAELPQLNEPQNHPPVNQFAFVSSFWSFVHAIIVSPEHVLIYNASEEELMGFLHFWAFIGAAMGIDDKYNICLQPNLTVAKQYYLDFLKLHVLSKALRWDYEYKVFSERTLQALQELVPFAPGTGGMFYRICEDLLHIQCPLTYKTLTPQERIYNMFFGGPAHALLRFKPVKSAAGFLWNGLVQVGAIKDYNFNTLDYSNFTAGIHGMDEENLRAAYDLFYHRD